MDLESRSRWVEYSRAKDENFRYTDTKQSPWFVVNSDDKKRARLNVISHLLKQIHYEEVAPETIELPPRQPDDGYIRPPMSEQTFVPEVFCGLSDYSGSGWCGSSSVSPSSSCSV